MLIKNQKVKMLKCVRHEGVKKNGEKYLFYSASFLDEGSNVLRMNFSNSLSANTELTSKLDDAVPQLQSWHLI